MSNANFDRIVEAINEHPFKVAHTLSALIIHLGSREEWSMDDNFYTTETIAGLAQRIGLPKASNQSESALQFYRDAGGDL